MPSQESAPIPVLGPVGEDPALFTIACRELTVDSDHILALGWPGEDGGEGAAGPVFIPDIAAATPPNSPYDAAVWQVAPTGAGNPSPLHQTADLLRGLLSATAPLVALVPVDNAVERESVLGRLPSGRQELLRSTIRALSEHGFAIRKERHLRPGDEKTAPFEGQSEGWHLLVARRDPFVIRPYREGDEKAILHLFPSCFFVERSTEHWRWKYAENPWGRHISVALAPNGALAAHYAGYGMPFWYQEAGSAGRTFPALQVGDTMTHPHHRNVGRGKNSLLARTVRHFFALHRGGPYGFFYGFNTGPIQRFCSWFIGGSRVEPVAFWTRDGEPPPETSRGYRVDRVYQTGPSFDRLFRRAAPHYRFLVQRDANYVTWRYLQCPDTEFVLLTARRWGRLVAWSVFRRRNDVLLWGDALFRPRHTRAAAALLRAALTLPEHRGVVRVEAWFPARPTWWSEKVEQLGFHRQPHPDGLALMALPDTEEQAVEQLQNLYYTQGDSDLF